MNSEQDINTEKWRKTTQNIRPIEYTPSSDNSYDLYPVHSVGSDKIDIGYEELAQAFKGHKKILIDGYVGVFWEQFRVNLNTALKNIGVQVKWIDVSKALKPAKEIKDFIAPFLGGDDPIFGTRYQGELIDFFDEEKLNDLSTENQSPDKITIIYGCGSALTGGNAALAYVDLPKSELQFRSRAGSVLNLGAEVAEDPKKMYKRFYFVDWIVLNKHKEALLPEIDWIIDEQQPSKPALMKGQFFREALHDMSKTNFRVRPWFEPGTWGGQWCKEHIPQLPQDVVNYAWSFELITPENGLIFSSDNKLLEVSFDWLMYQEYEAVLGDCAKTFKYEFPIRFDFLDTFEGGNLSVQCHPKPEFIKKEFGETFTQDETYYMLDCTPEAEVYLGFQEDIDPAEFRKALEQSTKNNTPVKIEKYVQKFQANKHDLFLIPHGTIHCSGIGNLVLEISATPYIFTFKMYDWLRLDLDGNPRPINIERAFENLNFDLQGKRVPEKLISKPTILKEGEDWQVVHLPTHEDHFYDIIRYEFEEQIEANTDGSCHIMSVVEGGPVRLETKNGPAVSYNYAETFVVPAAAESYQLNNEGANQAKVVVAFMKNDYEKSL